MKKYYYHRNGVDAEWQGPHFENEIIIFLRDGILKPDTQICEEKGEEGPHRIDRHPDFEVDFEDNRIEVDANRNVKPADDDARELQIADEERIIVTRTTVPSRLRDIRDKLDELWEHQRESIMARIMVEDLPEEVEGQRVTINLNYKRIEEIVLDYWRRDGKLRDWIEDQIRTNGDYSLTIANFDPDLSGRQRKMRKILDWLEEFNLTKASGCYCVMQGEDCLYVGQAISLTERIRTHQDKVWMTNGTKIRILVPHRRGKMTRKKRLNILERLLYLHLQPPDNATSPPKGGSYADDTLRFIMGEIRELATDAG